jgi:hypothetical protein
MWRWTRENRSYNILTGLFLPVRHSLCLQMTAIRLYPPLFEEGRNIEFLRSGRTLSAAQSPRDNSVVVFATNAVR